MIHLEVKENDNRNQLNLFVDYMKEMQFCCLSTYQKVITEITSYQLEQCFSIFISVSESPRKLDKYWYPGPTLSVNQHLWVTNIYSFDNFPNDSDAPKTQNYRFRVSLTF